MYVNLNMSQKNCNRKIAKCTLQGDPKCMKVVIPLCPIQCYTLNAQQPDSNVITRDEYTDKSSLEFY